MKIDYFNASALRCSLKATVQSTGRLGFNHTAEATLDLAAVKAVRIGRGADYDQNGTLYLATVDSMQSDCFSVLRAGKYFYVNTKPLFDWLKLDYQTARIEYQIEETMVDGKRIFKLYQKKKERKKA